MSELADTAVEYLKLRRLLGHNLDEAHRLLPRFVDYLDSIEATTVTVNSAIAWATDGVDPATTVGARRIGIARGFARHMAGIDEHTEIPPLGMIPMKQRWRPPFLFTPSDIEALLATARSIAWRLPAATHETLLGLLAATGLRVGEALRLENVVDSFDPQHADIRQPNQQFQHRKLVISHHPIIPAHQPENRSFKPIRPR